MIYCLFQDVLQGPIPSSDLLNLQVEGMMKDIGLTLEDGLTQESVTGYVRKAIELLLLHLLQKSK